MGLPENSEQFNALDSCIEAIARKSTDCEFTPSIPNPTVLWQDEFAAQDNLIELSLKKSSAWETVKFETVRFEFGGGAGDPTSYFKQAFLNSYTQKME